MADPTSTDDPISVPPSTPVPAARTSEVSTMLEPHVPPEPIHTWRGFLIHIGAIAIGLLLALLIEQTVEALHHRQQKLHLEEQMHEVIEDDTQIAAADFKQFEGFRAYLSELQAAVTARRLGQSHGAPPSATDPRMAVYFKAPGLAPYEAAKQDGTIVLLAKERLRIYARLAIAHSYLTASESQWEVGVNSLQAFAQRFRDSNGVLQFGHVVPMPDLAALSPAEIVEFQSLIAALAKQNDALVAFLHQFDYECRWILAGVHDEDELFRRANESLKSGSDPGSPR
jgi:hypothetical protein